MRILSQAANGTWRNRRSIGSGNMSHGDTQMWNAAAAAAMAQTDGPRPGDTEEDLPEGRTLVAIFLFSALFLISPLIRATLTFLGLPSRGGGLSAPVFSLQAVF